MLLNAHASEEPIRRGVGRDWDLTAEQCEALKARLMRNLDASAGPDGCWPWTGWTHGWGYGHTKIVVDGVKRGLNASRAMYIAEHGRISADQCVLHSCDNPPCCPGFTTPRATPEPVPALRPERVADAATRRAALDKIRADLDAARRKVEGR